MLLKHLRAAAVTLAALASAPLLADYHFDILSAREPMAQDAYDLHYYVLWVCVVIFFLVFGAMFWSIFKHRRSAGAKAAQFHENTTSRSSGRCCRSSCWSRWRGPPPRRCWR
jgi:cytochrome c oxidase subunit 2